MPTPVVGTRSPLLALHVRVPPESGRNGELLIFGRGLQGSRWLAAVSGGRVASVGRAAYPRFTRAMSARELAEVFTASAGQVEWRTAKTQDDRHLLALQARLKPSWDR